MNASKYVNPLTITITGIFLTLLAAVAIFFLLMKNTIADLNNQTAIYNENHSYQDPLQKKQADDGIVEATAKVAAIQATWNKVQYSKNPRIDYSNVMTAWKQLINELNFTLAPSIEQWMPTTGIKPLQAITTPPAPADPNQAVAQNPIVLPLNSGSPIEVVGSFPQILNHVAAWNNFNRIVLIDKLTLDGISPWIQGTYTATVYEFPINGTTPGTKVPSGAPAGNNGMMGGGMMGGGMNGGMMGGPMRMPTH